MKKRCLLLMMLLVVVSGCAENSALIRKNSSSTRSDVFEEPAKGGIAPKGFTDLRITGSLKTHKPGAHSASDDHGTPDYKLLLNIDGQAVLLHGKLQKENSEPMKLVDSEAGDGIRYWFIKSLRLKAGTHRIVVALPDDGIAVEKVITLVEGNVNSLVLEPVYCSTSISRRPGAYGATNFKEGIRGIRLTLNGRGI
jgi:hypothetical protein